MNEEFLKSLGIEGDNATEIVKEYARLTAIEQTNISTLEGQVENLNEQIKTRDADIKELKSQNSSNEELKTKFDTLQAKYSEQKTEHEKALTDLQLTNAIKLAIVDKAHDVDLTVSQLDKSKLTLKDGGVLGLDDQVKDLQTNKAFLFKSESTPTLKGVAPATSATGTQTGATYQEKLAEARKNGNNVEAIGVIEEAAANGQTLI